MQVIDGLNSQPWNQEVGGRSEKKPSVVRERATTPLSYVVLTQDSYPIRRNRRHLEHVPATDSPTGAPPETGDNAIISTVTAVGIPR